MYLLTNVKKKKILKRNAKDQKRSKRWILAWKEISELKHGTSVVQNNALSGKRTTAKKEPSNKPDDKYNCECCALKLEFWSEFT